MAASISAVQARGASRMDREVIPGQDGRGPSLYPTLAPRMLKNHIFLSLCLTFLILRIHLGGEAMTGYLEI